MSNMNAKISFKEASPPAAKEIVGLSIERLIEAAELLKASQGTAQTIELYRTWINLGDKPFRHVALFNLGALLHAEGDTAAAIEAYRSCLDLDPSLDQANINLGLIFEKSGLHDDALEMWGKVVSAPMTKVESKQLRVAAYNHIGRMQEERRLYDEAELALEQSLTLEPQQPGVIQHWVHIRQKACRWPIYKKLPGVTQNQMLMATSPLAMLALSDEPVQQLLTSQTFVTRTYQLKNEPYKGPNDYKHGRTRIGYVSGDLCVHAVGLLLAELIEHHDRSKLEIYAYDYSPEDGTAHRQRLKKAFDQWRQVNDLPDSQVADLVRHDEIDILIDLHGLSSGARPGIFALRPARLQGTYLGFIGTSAMPWFDFVIADPVAIPESLSTYFTERPLYTEGSFLPLPKSSLITDSIQRQDLGLPDDAFVMASFCNVYKVNQEMFNSWLNILKQVPNAVLWLIDDNPRTTEQLRQVSLEAGLSSERIIFSERTSHQQYRARIALADVFLDSFPYNCGSTTCDVVNAGVPLVTLCGKTMVSRMGASVLSALGLEQLITNSFQDYEQCVIELASNPQLKSLLQRRLKDALNSYQARGAMRVRTLESNLLKRLLTLNAS